MLTYPMEERGAVPRLILLSGAYLLKKVGK